MSDHPPFFAEARREIARVVREMRIDLAAFERPLAPCRIKSCGGNCCHDGATLMQEEVEPLLDLLDASGEGLVSQEAHAATPIARDRDGVWKTAAVPSDMSVRISEYPKHFPDTKCVFLEDSGVCRLQRKAMEEGIDPWRYKPFTCWMHPLTIGRERGRHLLTLRNEENDPQSRDGYPGFVCHTHCGRSVADGKPAYQVLRNELEYLGAIGGRNLVGEILEGLSDSAQKRG